MGPGSRRARCAACPGWSARDRNVRFPPLEPEYAVPWLAEGRIERCGKRDTQRIAGVDRVEHAVVPEFRRGIVGAHLRLVGAQGVGPYLLQHLGVRLHAVALELAQLDLDQRVRRLL